MKGAGPGGEPGPIGATLCSEKTAYAFVRHSVRDTAAKPQNFARRMNFVKHFVVVQIYPDNKVSRVSNGDGCF